MLPALPQGSLRLDVGRHLEAYRNALIHGSAATSAGGGAGAATHDARAAEAECGQLYAAPLAKRS